MENQEQTKTDSLDTPELNQAAYVFQTNVPRIKALASNMSRNGLARVFKAVVEFPLAEKYPNFKGVEMELFQLALSAISAKNVMSNAFMKQDGNAILQQTENELVDELLKEKTEGEQNG